jgi:hypothetical protein
MHSLTTHDVDRRTTGGDENIHKSARKRGHINVNVFVNDGLCVAVSNGDMPQRLNLFI